MFILSEHLISSYRNTFILRTVATPFGYLPIAIIFDKEIRIIIPSIVEIIIIKQDSPPA